MASGFIYPELASLHNPLKRCYKSVHFPTTIKRLRKGERKRELRKERWEAERRERALLRRLQHELDEPSEGDMAEVVGVWQEGQKGEKEDKGTTVQEGEVVDISSGSAMTIEDSWEGEEGEDEEQTTEEYVAPPGK